MLGHPKTIVIKCSRICCCAGSRQVSLESCDATTGPGLLDLHVEILQAIAWHYTARQWAQGPGSTCCLPYNLQLPRMDLTPCKNSWEAARLSRRGMNAAMQKTASSFKWAVRRIGPVTTSLVLYSETIGKKNGAKQGTSARHLRAFDHAQLKQLKVLDARTYFCDLKSSAERANFLTAWLTKHTPCFRVLRMQTCNPELILDIFPLQQLKHLDLELCLCDIELSQTVRYLPQLQTLQLCAAPVGLYVTELDVSQCRHFKALLLSHVGVGRLLKPPTCIVFRLADFLTYLSATGLVN